MRFTIRSFRPLFYLVSAVLIVGWGTSVLAASTNDRQHITITPSSTELSIAPGQSADSTLTLINQGSDSFTATTSVSPYHVEGIDYDPQFTQLPGTVDASQWVHLHSSQAQVLAPGQLYHADYTVSVPAGTAPGGYYAVIFAQTSPLTTGSGVVPHNRVGEILYLTVKGPVHIGGKVLAGPLGSFSTSGNISIGTLVQNTGGVHFKTTVTATVKNLFGKQVFTHSAQRYVLPQTERLVSLSWTDHVPIGIYRITRQATLPSGTVTLPSKLVVIVQPWLMIVIIIVLVVLLATWIRHRREKGKQA